MRKPSRVVRFKLLLSLSIVFIGIAIIANREVGISAYLGNTYGVSSGEFGFLVIFSGLLLSGKRSPVGVLFCTLPFLMFIVSNISYVISHHSPWTFLSVECGFYVIIVYLYMEVFNAPRAD